MDGYSPNLLVLELFYTLLSDKTYSAQRNWIIAYRTHQMNGGDFDHCAEVEEESDFDL